MMYMNAMDDNLQTDANDFNPTKELGNLAKYAAEKAFGNKNYGLKAAQYLHLDFSTLNMIFEGTWNDKSDYIRLLSLCVCRIRPKKVKLKKLPDSLPNRTIIESLETGVEENILLYKKVILELCLLPDIPPKTKNRNIIVGDPLYISYNSDFEYGITDT